MRSINAKVIGNEESDGNSPEHSLLIRADVAEAFSSEEANAAEVFNHADAFCSMTSQVCNSSN